MRISARGRFVHQVIVVQAARLHNFACAGEPPAPRGNDMGNTEVKPSASSDAYPTQIERFTGVRKQYEELAACLIHVLEHGAAKFGLHPIVQARAKTVASFAEKIIRKRYADPFK